MSVVVDIYAWMRRRPAAMAGLAIGAVLFAFLFARNEQTRSRQGDIVNRIVRIEANSPCTKLTTRECAVKLLGSLDDRDRETFLRQTSVSGLAKRIDRLQRQRITSEVRRRTGSGTTTTTTVMPPGTRVVVPPRRSGSQATTPPRSGGSATASQPPSASAQPTPPVETPKRKPAVSSATVTTPSVTVGVVTVPSVTATTPEVPCVETKVTHCP